MFLWKEATNKLIIVNSDSALVVITKIFFPHAGKGKSMASSIEFNVFAPRNQQAALIGSFSN